MSVAAQTQRPAASEIIARLRGMQEQLRDEQAETEARTYHSESLHRQLVDSGVYKMLLPLKFGGYELPMGDFLKAISETARGCPSTGWCVCLAGAHVLTVASIFNETVQSEVFGPDGDFRCPARAVPYAPAVPTDGGWSVEGRWDYCSGAPYATHLLAAVRMPADADDTSSIGCALIPRAQWTMQDDWGNQLGMKGSGSHSIVADAQLGADYVIPVSIQDVHPGEHTPKR